jgi:hypothetical protein
VLVDENEWLTFEEEGCIKNFVVLLLLGVDVTVILSFGL